MKIPVLVGAVLVIGAAACAQQKGKMEFQYAVTLGAGDMPLQMTIRDGRVEVLKRPGVANEGAVIGVFRGPAGAALLSAIEKATPSSMPAVSGLRPGASVVTVSLKTAEGKTVQFTAPADSQYSGPLAALSKLVHEEAERVPAVRSVQVEFAGLADGGARAVKVRLKNAGTEAVALDWNEQSILSVVGLPKGGSLETLTAGKVAGPAPAAIPARGQVECVVPVQFPSKGSWMVRAEYQVRFVVDVGSHKVGGAVSSVRATVQVP